MLYLLLFLLENHPHLKKYFSLPWLSSNISIWQLKSVICVWIELALSLRNHWCDLTAHERSLNSYIRVYQGEQLFCSNTVLTESSWTPQGDSSVFLVFVYLMSKQVWELLSVLKKVSLGFSELRSRPRVGNGGIGGKRYHGQQEEKMAGAAWERQGSADYSCS